MSPVLKYSNWFVAAFLFVVGIRVLFAILQAFLRSGETSVEKVAAPLLQPTMAVLFLVASVGIVRWKSWGRSLAATLCAWNAFAALFLTHWGPKHRVARLSFCLAFVIITTWFYLPRVKIQFAQAKAGFAPSPANRKSPPSTHIEDNRPYQDLVQSIEMLR